MILRDAVMDDTAFVWQCRLELEGSVALAASRTQDFAAHLAWMTGIIKKPRHMFLIPEREGKPLGYVRFDPATELGGWRTSLCIAAAARGTGAGRMALSRGCAMAQAREYTPIFADIHADNLASQIVFARCGYTAAGPAPNMPGYVRHWLYSKQKDAINA
jgi:L-amino acid N-acyltransferase YncA